MTQPKPAEITNRLKDVIDGKRTREEVGRWALEYIIHDADIEITDVNAWHELVSVSSIDEMTAPNVYLYSVEDIQEWIEKSPLP